MAVRGMSVSVNIGAKVAGSFGSSISRVEQRFGQMGRKLKLIGAEMKASFRNIGEMQGIRRNQMLEGAAFAFGAKRALDPFMNFEDALVRMGNTADMHGPRLEAIGMQIVQTGARIGIGGSQAIVGANDFIDAGSSITTAMSALGPTLMLAKTAGVEVGEASQAGIALMQNLKVKATDLGKAFDFMAKAGKEGRFEINDMAKAFPGVASRANVLGMSGLGGVARMSAMLQITRTNARDADEASNNLLNFLDKLTSGDSVKKFSKMGVDVEAVFKRSKARGVDFVDSMLDQLDRLTGGGKGGVDGFALSALFEDRQARQAALALIQNRKEYDRIRKASLGGGGTLNADFKNIKGTSKFGLDRFAAGLERIGIALGRSFGPTLGAAAERFASFAERLSGWADKSPATVKAIGLTAASLVGLRTAVAGLGFVFGGVAGKVVRFLGGGLMRSMGALTTNMGVMLLNGLARIGPWILRGLGIAFGIVSGPVGWALLAASIGALLYTYWDKIKAIDWRGLGSTIVSGIAYGLGFAWGKMSIWWSTAWTGVSSYVSGIDWGATATTTMNGLAYGLGLAWAKVTEWWSAAWTGIVNYVKGIDWGALASNIGSKLASGIKTALSPSSWGLGGMLASAAQSWNAGVAAGSTMPVKAGPSQVKIAGARAKGGPMGGGKPYLVGEEGPELVIPRNPGTVLPAHATAAAMSGSGAGADSARSGRDTNIHVGKIIVQGAHDPNATAKAVRDEIRKMARRQNALMTD